LHTLPASIGLSSDGTFAVYQSILSWHGFGVKALIDACQRQGERYVREPGAWGPWHHREHCILFSGIRAGWVIITFQLKADGSGKLSYGEMELRFPGVPVNAAPYRRLAKSLRQEGYFESLPNRWPSETVHIEDGPVLKVVGTIIEDNGQWVRGLVCENPYSNPKLKLPSLGDRGSVGSLRDSDRIICTLAQLHKVDDKVDYYKVTRISTISNSLRQPIEVYCDWHELTYRSSRSPAMPAVSRARSAKVRY
jgi:hypothetical protein